jgi:RNA-splicing ligase RtcB
VSADPFPGQRGFVGGSMGDDAVIVEGVDGPAARAALYSTVHGAGRAFGRKEAKRRFSHAEMDAWLRRRGVTLVGADLDESPMAYRRLPEVLAYLAAFGLGGSHPTPEYRFKAQASREDIIVFPYGPKLM